MTSDELKEKMERYGYTDRTLGEELGCTTQAVWAWRRDKTKIPLHVKKFFERLEMDEEMAEEAVVEILGRLLRVAKPLRMRVMSDVMKLL